MKKISVVLTVSDPWEFGEGPFGGDILAETYNPENKKFLLQLIPPVKHKNQLCEYFVVEPRGLVSNLLEEILNKKSVKCCLTMIPKEQAQSSDPLNISHWRGGVALIGDITLLTK